MTTPRFFITACLLIWAWQTGLAWVAAFMAIVLEWARYSRSAWQLNRAQQHRLGDGTILLMLLATFYAFLAVENNPIMTLLQTGDPFPRRVHIRFTINPYYSVIVWLPILLFPLAVLQAYGRQPLPYTMFSWLYRRGVARRGEESQCIDFSYPYAVAILIGSGAGNQRIFLFYAALCMIVAWGLLAQRKPRYPIVLWGLMLAIAMKLGYHGAVQLNRLQGWVEHKAINAFQPTGSRFDPLQSRTHIGSIGEQKLSGVVVARLGTPERAPEYLRTCLYSVYIDGRWLTGTPGFDPILAKSKSGTRWALQPGPEAPRKARLWMRSHYDPMILPLPSDTSHLSRFPANVGRNASGTVRAQDPPSPVFFDLHYGSGQSFEGPVIEEDLQLPEQEPVIAEIAHTLQLHTGHIAEKTATIRRFFDANFSYSLFLERGAKSADVTPLADFLRHTHKGHCEYFASATVLLLRAAGIPARYCTGFAVAEGQNGRYIIRQRHAHAWVRYFDGKDWQDIDTTPATWIDVETANASPWEFVTDARSWLGYIWARLRNSEHRHAIAISGFALVLLFIAWRGGFFRKSKPEPEEEEIAESSIIAWPGSDSELFELEASLASRGFRRPAWQSLDQWLLGIAASADLDQPTLLGLVRLHLRLRFDPQGLAGDERNKLARGVALMMAQS
jgi:transglutaminase-like putative cysteine protease